VFPRCSETRHFYVTLFHSRCASLSCQSYVCRVLVFGIYTDNVPAQSYFQRVRECNACV
jgi:hypothetical protein